MCKMVRELRNLLGSTKWLRTDAAGLSGRQKRMAGEINLKDGGRD